MNNSTQTTFLTSLAELFSRQYRRVSRFFGRQSDQQVEPIKVYTDLCLAQAARRANLYASMALPETLLQAFSVEPLAAGDARFVGREEQLNHVLAALEMWRDGRTSMVAVTGPQGCGISSFLQQLAQLVGDNEIYHYGKLTHLPYDINDSMALLSAVIGREQSVGSLEELVEYINGLPPSVFAIDDGHFLACRIMGRSEAIRVFGAVIVATQQRHLWVLGCQEYAWRRLAYVYRADRYFTERIELPMFSEAELGQCLTARLQASGITLISEMTREGPQMPAGFARQLNTLYKLGNGKPDFSFFYFLGSLNVHDENKRWDIRPVTELHFSILKQLISEELFTLTEVAAHGQLTIDQHRALFRTSHEESWLLLERLYHLCLLDKNGTASEPAYHLVPLYSDVISRHLTNANYLY